MKVTRLKAAGIHLAVSSVIAAATVIMIVLVWYPPPLFSGVGGQLFLALIVGIDLCLGPLLTLVVYNPAKARWKLIMNLSVIGICQIVALVYGVIVVFNSRPVYIVYAKEKIVVVTADYHKEINRDQAVLPQQYQSLPLLKAKWVGVKMPTDKGELETIASIRSMSGIDIHAYAKYYADIDESRKEMGAVAKPIDILKKLRPKAAAKIDGVIEKSGKSPDRVGYLPIFTPQLKMSALVDKDSGEVIKMLNVEPD